MPPALMVALVTACAGATPPPAGPPAPGPRSLEAVVDSIVGTPPLERTHWGIEVYDATAGRTILRRNAEHHFMPASNQEVLTFASAIGLLGPDFRYETELVAEGVVDGVAERLVIHGSGDPSLSELFNEAPFAALDSVADSLARAGLRQVDGPVVIDQSGFDSVLVHPAWETGDLDWYYAAPVAAFAVEESAIPVAVFPGGQGEPARVSALIPDGLVAFDARIATVTGERGWNDELRRLSEADSIVLRGEVGVGADPDTAWIAQIHPGVYAGRALVLALRRRGIAVTGPVTVRFADDGGAEAVSSTSNPPGRATEPEPRDGAVAAAGAPSIRSSWRSPPLMELADIALLRSDNWITEQVLKTLGARLGEAGSWSAGTAVVERFLADSVGIPEDATYMRDGSGLTAQNLITPGAMVQLLRYVRDQPWGAAFRSALAEPGEEDGTLERRLLALQGRLWAKTGSIRNVNTLSGYLRTDSGHDLVFSILTNGSGQPAGEVRSAIDRVVQAMNRSGS